MYQQRIVAQNLPITARRHRMVCPPALSVVIRIGPHCPCLCVGMVIMPWPSAPWHMTNGCSEPQVCDTNIGRSASFFNKRWKGYRDRYFSIGSLVFLMPSMPRYASCSRDDQLRMLLIMRGTVLQVNRTRETSSLQAYKTYLYINYRPWTLYFNPFLVSVL